MVLLTEAYVKEECSRTQSMKSLTKGIEKDHVKKITHLYMNDKFISAIVSLRKSKIHEHVKSMYKNVFDTRQGDLSNCRGLKVIYLQNNCISKIENLGFAENVVHLYLQHNDLKKLENLDSLRNLTKLCLGHNRISVVEGLENLEKLSELRIEKQKLAAGESLIFEPRTAHALSVSHILLHLENHKYCYCYIPACFHSKV